MAAGGDRIADRYVLEAAIGKGGMGVVWQAWDELLERRVALKCARPDDAEAAGRLIKEARNAARLHHPNIVQVFNVEKESGAYWIVMEYVPSRNLAQLVAAADGGTLPPGQAGSIGSQIAGALAKSHSEGVVHGDVTPENILVTEEGVARLTDFGISRALWSDVTETSVGTVRGKPRYLAPEVARGRTPDAKSDVFSLGASLFAAVEGASPYGEFENVMGYLGRAMAGDVAEPHRAGLLTGPLTALLTVDPRRRPAAHKAYALLDRAAPPPEHVREHLDGTLRDGRTLRLGRADGGRLPGFPRRRRRLLWGAAGAVVVAVALGVELLGPWSPFGDDRPGDGSDGARRPAAAGAVGAHRTADPCGLLDAASLSRFGRTELDPDYGEFDRCDVLVSKGDTEVADVQVNLSSAHAAAEGARTRRVGNLVVTGYQRDGDQCERSVATPDHAQVLVIARRMESAAPDPCTLADAATDHAVGVLDHGPVPRRAAAFPADSLAHLDACALLGAGPLEHVAHVRPRPVDRGFGDWECTWSDADDDHGVELVFERDNTLSDDGRAASVAGTTSRVSPRESGDDSCLVRTPHRSFTNAVGDHTVELFTLTVYAPGGDRCATAKTLAADVVREAAERLPAR